MSAFRFTEFLYTYLETALDCGIRECEFWEMTIAELNRFIDSWKRKSKIQAQETAVHNYILAGLVTKGIASYFDSNIEFPKIEEVYSNLFNEQAEETKEKQLDKVTEASVARFMQFATFHNNKYKVVENISE